jgi:4-hydroxy-3-methylbut-2-enyl diphosphate reductase
MTQRLLVLVPLRVEASALRTGPGWHVLRSGMGPARAQIAAARGLAVTDAVAVAVVGVCAAVSPGLRPGDVVCATEVRRAGAEPIETDRAELLASAVRSLGLRALVGPIVSTEKLSRRDERRRLDQEGVLAVDMESAWLAAAAAGRSLAVLRVVVEPAGRHLVDPRTVSTGLRALANLRRACPALTEWSNAITSTDIPVPEPPALVAL